MRFFLCRFGFVDNIFDIRSIAFLANELKMSDEYNNFEQSMQSIIDNYASFYKK